MTVRLDGQAEASTSRTMPTRSRYAATIHKAQGVTVDRVHVLATPGLDRHAAYVALSRHRDSVQLYYGSDDFAEAKPPASYRGNAPRTWRVTMSATARCSTVAKRTISHRTHRIRRRSPSAATTWNLCLLRPKPASVEPNMSATDSERVSDQQVAIQRYARSALDIARMQEQELPVLPHQRQAQDRARAALDAIRPHAARDLDSASTAMPSFRATRRTAHATRNPCDAIRSRAS